MWLDEKQFEAVVAATPLVSIDLVIRDSSKKVLLGQRANRPAKGFWFVPGGRIQKNENISAAFSRLLSVELGVTGYSIDSGRFLGVYQHFYSDSVFGNSPSTHYVVLGFELVFGNLDIREMPLQQHQGYKWFSVSDLVAMDDVHQHTKDYFCNSVCYQ
ncbi:GDP-mannose mannosyl hydrolase [uncultured Spongiibacter sp.]|uniref:GDP-mannose mannosyl hydrolase n=1 Tax=uncultured Spongiibacter sp. TaxID=870896 RepID=UPI0025895ED1|nr:GDP-mannose mannosyl hydrolase [uncultured Spongiibacter sp.]